ncbi:MAG: 30S ribosomal protein S4 [Candidatus Pacebacteria bacterium]|nr:30S ribosomal protein S4 [Candidatus Paceibacterota bacterium]
MHIIKSKEKKERSLQAKLGLKAHRCNSPKCAMVRRPNKPGVHGGKFARAGSEFKQQLVEKQRIKVSYGLTEKQIRSIFRTALGNKKSVTNAIVSKLETRLDNVVFRLGLAPSRIVARQIVGHGHIIVNKRKVTIPSFAVSVGDVISVREQDKHSALFKELPGTLRATAVDSWLSLDPALLTGTVNRMPEGVQLPFNINLVVDYFSR